MPAEEAHRGRRTHCIVRLATRFARRSRMPFTDRREAGRRLGAEVVGLGLDRPVVLGLPRGGVPVAYEVARALEAPLDVLVVRKLGCPWQPELGLGAIGEDGVRLLNAELIRATQVGAHELEAVARREGRELERRVERYRQGRPAIELAGRTVLVVDDGLATGFTARAGLEVVRRRGAQRVVLAVPVAPGDTLAELAEVADDVVCLETPAWFSSIGAFYSDFSQTSDAEVTELLAAADGSSGAAASPVATTDPQRAVEIPAARGVTLPGELAGPAAAAGVVVFAHGSGSSRRSPRNLAVARTLNDAGLATLLFDLLTDDEAIDRAKVFDIGLLADRLVAATRWLQHEPEVAGSPVGYFGASTGAAAALWAAAELGTDIAAVVSRGGRPDLAAERLAEVTAPTLLIVGGRDTAVLDLNEQARRLLRCPSGLEIVPGATHLFEEPGAMDAVATSAADWFRRHLSAAATSA
jgi:putative phosphoribosyl transferase